MYNLLFRLTGRGMPKETKNDDPRGSKSEDDSAKPQKYWTMGRATDTGVGKHDKYLNLAEHKETITSKGIPRRCTRPCPTEFL